MSDTVVDTPTTGQKFTAEALGTFVLVFFGCGAFLMSGGDYVATGLTFGLTVVVMAYAVGRVSGAHFNPAVTVGAAMGGRIAWRQVPPLRRVASSPARSSPGLALFTLMQGFETFDAEGSMGQNSFGDDGSGYAWWAALLLELLMTLLFVLVILAVTDARFEHPRAAPLAIGLTLSAISHFASMGATGTSVNPARSIGVGVFAGTDAIVQLWLFVVAPLVGAAIAGLTYPVLFGQGAEPVAGSGLNFGGGRKDQFVPGNYEAQLEPMPAGRLGPARLGLGAPPQQQWGQPQQQPQQPQQPLQQPDPYGAPQGQPQGQPAQWGQPAPQQPRSSSPASPVSPVSGALPRPQPGQQPGQSAPGHSGNPEGHDDGGSEQPRRPTSRPYWSSGRRHPPARVEVLDADEAGALLVHRAGRGTGLVDHLHHLLRLVLDPDARPLGQARHGVGLPAVAEAWVRRHRQPGLRAALPRAPAGVPVVHGAAVGVRADEPDVAVLVLAVERRLAGGARRRPPSWCVRPPVASRPAIEVVPFRAPRPSMVPMLRPASVTS